MASPWITLESNPDVLSKFLQELGVDKSWGLKDILSLDPENAGFCAPTLFSNYTDTASHRKKTLLNSQAMLLSFLAEKSLPFSLAPDIIDLAKALSQDRKVLSQMTMHRTAASYKLRYGVAKTFQEKLLNDLHFFSLNIDESTSSNFQKAVAVLVNIPSENREIVTKHLSSFSIVKGDSETLFQEVVKIFEENNIPWNNLVSVAHVLYYFPVSSVKKF